MYGASGFKILKIKFESDRNKMRNRHLNSEILILVEFINIVKTNQMILKVNFQPFEFLYLFPYCHDVFVPDFELEYFVASMYNQNNHGESLAVTRMTQQDCPNTGIDVLDLVAVAASPTDLSNHSNWFFFVYALYFLSNRLFGALENL